jgi:flagellar motor protein MotB
VFFDWNRADLNDRARQIIAEAASARSQQQVTRIEVNGYTDTSGSPQYNQGLSVRRANAVAAGTGAPRRAAAGNRRPGLRRDQPAGGNAGTTPASRRTGAWKIILR